VLNPPLSDNVLLTSLIIGRLIWFGRRTREALGSAGNKYMTIATIMCVLKTQVFWRTRPFIIFAAEKVRSLTPPEA
jgi:hypothetical protein